MNGISEEAIIYAASYIANNATIAVHERLHQFAITLEAFGRADVAAQAKSLAARAFLAATQTCNSQLQHSTIHSPQAHSHHRHQHHRRPFRLHQTSISPPVSDSTARLNIVRLLPLLPQPVKLTSPNARAPPVALER